jgi:hypothetical protein
MLHNLKHKLISFDLFGHPINLRFGTHGHEFKTLEGGIVSLLIKITMLAMISDMFLNMIGYKDNRDFNQSRMLTNEEMLQTVTLKDMVINLYVVV